MKKSIWQKDLKNNNFKSINENLNTDILIIGAGISGVSTAYNLLNINKNIVIIEKDKLFNGVTSKSTAKITYLQDLIYHKICSMYDFSYAKLYYESQKEAIDIIKSNIKKNNIDCNFKKVSTITFTNDEKEFNNFDKEQEILNKLNVKYYTNDKLLKNKVKRLIKVNDTYIFNPIKYLNGLLKVIKKNKNVKIFENSIATSIKKEKDYYIVCVNNFEIRTKNVVIATNYPFFVIPGFIPFKTYFEKSYVSASKVKNEENISAITSNYPIKSFRYYYDGKHKYLIYLNNSSKICDKLNYNKNFNQNRQEIYKITGKVPSYSWMNTDVMTNDYLPIISKVSKNNKKIFIITGFNTWGMTNSAISSKIIKDMIENKDNKYIDLFSISRKITFKKIINFMSNTFLSNLKAYTFNLIKKNPYWNKNKAIITTINNKRVGIYIDENNNKHIVSNICPHLKCFLTFNTAFKSWDCPCHASRFDIDGNCIKGPSKYNIKIEKT